MLPKYFYTMGEVRFFQYLTEESVADLVKPNRSRQKFIKTCLNIGHLKYRSPPVRGQRRETCVGSQKMLENAKVLARKVLEQREFRMPLADKKNQSCLWVP